MLISHLHRFIYMKTFKTAGTSVELYFERYCADPDREFEERHEREAEVSRWGIIGARGQEFVPGRTWYNHMPAGRVRDLIGGELWSQYYKLCVVRHPFDKMVSSFWHNLPDGTRSELQHADFEMVRRHFQDWLRTAEHPMDRDVFTIGGQPVMNGFVRFEDLHAGLEGVCRHLGLPWDPRRLGRYKSGTRLRDEAFVRYYDRPSADLVRELYRWELEYFEYPTDAKVLA
jgi:hypothetical protein